MFLSQQGKLRPRAEDELGFISVGGDAPTVSAGGLQVDSPVFGPGGMIWVPKRGQTVLVIKSGGEYCVAGAEMKACRGMEPGELGLYSEKASLWIKNDGTICLEGRVLINGKELEV